MKNLSEKLRREKRIQQKENNLNKWMDRIKDKNYSNFSHLSNEDKSIEAHIAANHGKRCSCPACGNPRRNPWAKKREQQTLQERRMSEYEEEDE